MNTPSSKDNNTFRRFDYFLLGILLFVNAIFLKYNAFRTFNFHDMGLNMDACWRILNGQHPYRDFIYQSGPLHLYMNVLFYKIFGFGKTAVWAHIVVIHSIVISVVFFTSRKKLPFLLTILVTALTVPSFLWNISHPWWDLSAHFWGIIGVGVLARNIPFDDDKTAFRNALWCGFLAILSFMTKPNIGGMYGLIFFVTLLGSSRRIKATIGYTAGVALGTIVSLILIRHPLLFWDQATAHSQAVFFPRISELFTLKNWFVHYYWLIFLSVMAALFPYYKRNAERILLFSGMTILAIFAINTSGIIREANIFLWGIVMMLAFIVLFEAKDLWAAENRRIVLKSITTFLVMLTVGFTIIAVRQGLELKVWRYFIQSTLGTYTIQSKPLDGWRAHLKQGKPLDDLVKAIRENIPEGDRILNLTDMYVIYALTGRQSFPGITVAFWPNQTPAAGRQTEQVRQAILSNLPEWIVTDAGAFDKELVYLKIQDEIKRLYKPVARSGIYLLLRRIQ